MLKKTVDKPGSSGANRHTKINRDMGIQEAVT